MKFSESMLRLYAVTDRSWTGRQTLLEQVESALKGGATCVQLREKELDFEAFLAEAVELKALCGRYGVPLIINDNVEIALRCGADGVHVGQEDMEAGGVRAKVGPDMIVGVTAMLLFHVFENIGMTLGLMPITGIPLPFLSYGGSNMTTNMGGIALVLNVTKNRSLSAAISTPQPGTPTNRYIRRR